MKGLRGLFIGGGRTYRYIRRWNQARAICELIIELGNGGVPGILSPPPPSVCVCVCVCEVIESDGMKRARGHFGQVYGDIGIGCVMSVMLVIF